MAMLEPGGPAFLPQKGSWGPRQAEGTVTRAQHKVGISLHCVHSGLGTFKLEIPLLASAQPGFLNHGPMDILGWIPVAWNSALTSTPNLHQLGARSGETTPPPGCDNQQCR